MEEYVGKKWHQWVTGTASTDHENAAVLLEDVHYQLGVVFRALGGEVGLKITIATPRDYYTQRSWMQKLAGSHQQVSLAWRDGDTLRLPQKISLFTSVDMNFKLYLWLTALAATQSQPIENWWNGNQSLVTETLAAYPGLKKDYLQLVEAHILQRPLIEELDADQQVQEQAIRDALRQPGSIEKLPIASYAPFPVYLWLYPGSMNDPELQQMVDCDDEGAVNSPSRKQKKMLKKKAERVENPAEQKGLMVFRLESLFSWTEFVPVDRAEDDTDEDNADSLADDLDTISLSKTRKASSSSIKFDLDLPSAANDDLVLGEGILLPEWDYRRQLLEPHYVKLLPMIADDAEEVGLPAHLRGDAVKLRRQFSQLKPLRHWQHRQLEGEEIDLDGWQEFQSQQLSGTVNADPRLYRSFSGQVRDLSCLMLADLSLSTDSWVNNSQRVIDVIQDSLLLFSEALSATGDRFALYGFSSRKRDHVRFHVLKNFNERYNDKVRGRIMALKPGYYTRMGAAIRQATKILANERSHQRVLLLLTDGKPNDLDQYEGRYGIEDTRMAIIEAKKRGLQPFCVTIDDEADQYLPHLFGSNGYVVIKKPQQLPAELPKLYVNLTQ